MDLRRGLESVGRGAGQLTKLVAALAIVAVLTPVVAAGTALATQLFLPLPAAIPEPEELEAIQFSEVYDKNGELIHVYQQFDRNIPVSPGDIPEVVKNAVVAAEDRNFYGHEGFDIRGTVRALVTDVREGSLEQGGSTITQQLARNAYGAGTERTINRKIREAILASQLDRSLSKEQILHEYLSIVYFGEGAYGIGAAAQVYFQKPVNDLDLSEAALLAGIIPAPSRFNPRVDPGTAEIRRVSVLDAMLEEGLITQAEYDEAAPRELWLDSQGFPPLTDGEDSPPVPITLVRTPQLEESKYPYFIQYLTEYLVEELGSDKPLYRGGLRIDTTFDPAVQAEAEAAMAETLEGIGDIVTVDPETGEETTHRMQMSISAIEPPTGFVRALVGGRDFRLNQTNMATGAGTFQGRGRQPGSSFKPYVLAEAFEQGIKPTEIYSGGPLTIGDYSPQNYGGAVYGNMTLRNATENSVNTVFVRLMQDVGPYEVVDLTNELGLEIPEIDPSVDGSGLSIALGSREVTTLEQASGFGTFANRGVRVPPTPVVRVFAPDGEVLVDRSQPEGEQVLKQATADNVTDVLRGVLTGGTAADNGIGRPAAGKTGTTQDNRDGWFVGYTPTLSTAVWMGYDPLTPNGEGISLTGGSLPAATWERFMRAALQGVPATDFSEPAPIEQPASEERRRERRGFAPGPRDGIISTGTGGPYMRSLSPPDAPAPTSTTTTSTTSTTTTTLPGPTTTTTDPCDGIIC